ncbi:MAG: TIGR01777 family oxidoreductase [Kofleriaceae bacterium]
MNFLVTGATGFVGRALLLRLARDHHQVTAWVRDPDRARAALGPGVALVRVDDDAGLGAAIADADVVINLAGEPIVGRRWTRARKAALRASRVDTTQRLVAAMAANAGAARRPVLVSASAVGLYGDRGDEVLSEHAPAGRGFAAELCVAWEAAAEAARPYAARVVLARIGVVLGREGGALAPLARLTRFGLGGPIAGGRQWVPWIHLDDLVEALVRASVDARLDGAVNLVAPQPARQRDLARALGRALHRPAWAPAPRLALRALLGEAASVLTSSQRVVPSALAAIDHRFRFADLDGALADLTSAPAVSVRRLGRGEAPTSAYLRQRRPREVLRARAVLDAPLAQVVRFFAAAENLNLLVPPAMAFEIQTPRPIAMAPGTTIDYRLRVLGVPFRWRTVIEAWQPPGAPAPAEVARPADAYFVDAQHRGPYRAWWHEHHFIADGERTIMEDHVYYASPLGPLGALADRVMVRAQLRRIFGFRAAAIRLRYGDGGSA